MNKRRGALAAAIALNAFVNYFFFIGECVFLVIYFIGRLCCDRRFRINVGDFFCLAFECIVGVLIAGVLFVPSIFQVLDVPRSTNILTDSSFLFFGKEQRYGLLLEAMFFPPEIAARTNMFPDASAKWSSVALYLPLFSMAGVIAFFKGAKKHWAKAVLTVCLIMAFVPGLNSMFTMFNNNYYTRWFYMPELLCCLATVYALEHRDACDLKFSAVAVGIISLLVIFYPIKSDVLDSKGKKTGETQILPNFTELPVAVYFQIAIAVMFLILLGVLIHSYRKNPQFTSFTLKFFTILSCLVLGFYFVGYGRILGPKIGDYNKTVSADISIDDPDFYRIEAISEINNVNMLWDKSSLKSFTSIIPNATFELYDMLDIKRDVNSAPEESCYALRCLTGVKYLMVRSDYDEKKLNELLNDYQVFRYHSTQSDYDIYINELAFPIGFAYDNYIADDKIGSDSSVGLCNLLCHAVVLTEEQAEKYDDILAPIEHSDVRSMAFADFEENAKERIAAGVADFSITSNGFTARTEYAEDELVVFTVPFDSGWSATVNGESAEVEKVNGGLCAVRVSAGACDVVFTYETPGGKLGIICTIGGAALLGMYLVVFYGFMRRKPHSYAHLYARSGADSVKAHNAYITNLSKQIYNSPEKGNVRCPDEAKLKWADVEEFITENDISDAKSDDNK